MNKKSLFMRFRRLDGKKYSLAIPNPKEDISEEEVKNLMDFIVTNKLIIPSGVEISGTIDARITETKSDKYDLVID